MDRSSSVIYVSGCHSNQWSERGSTRVVGQVAARLPLLVARALVGGGPGLGALVLRFVDLSRADVGGGGARAGWSCGGHYYTCGVCFKEVVGYV
jgi:hypothetical protein